MHFAVPCMRVCLDACRSCPKPVLTVKSGHTHAGVYVRGQFIVQPNDAVICNHHFSCVPFECESLQQGEMFPNVSL